MKDKFSIHYDTNVYQENTLPFVLRISELQEYNFNAIIDLPEINELPEFQEDFTVVAYGEFVEGRYKQVYGTYKLDSNNDNMINYITYNWIFDNVWTKIDDMHFYVIKPDTFINDYYKTGFSYWIYNAIFNDTDTISISEIITSNTNSNIINITVESPITDYVPANDNLKIQQNRPNSIADEYYSNVTVNLNAIKNAAFLLEDIPVGDLTRTYIINGENVILPAGNINSVGLSNFTASQVKVVKSDGTYSDDSIIIDVNNLPIFLDVQLSDGTGQNQEFIPGDISGYVPQPIYFTGSDELPLYPKNNSDSNIGAVILQSISAALFKKFGKFSAILNESEISNNILNISGIIANTLQETDAGRKNSMYGLTPSKIFPLYLLSGRYYDDNPNGSEFIPYNFENFTIEFKLRVKGKIMDLTDSQAVNINIIKERIFNNSAVYIETTHDPNTGQDTKQLKYDAVIKIKLVNKQSY